VFLDHFDSNMANADVAMQRVELLERLIREERRVVVLFVDVEPLNLVTSSLDFADHADLISRLAAVLAQFTFADHTIPNLQREPLRSASILSHLREVFASFATPRSRYWRHDLVKEECTHPDLWVIREDLLKEPELDTWSKHQVIQQVHSRANAIYQHMWFQCTRIEKFTLIELARDNLVNPNNWDAARRLRLRGYVKSDPLYRLASESLGQFVRRMERIENVQSWRAENPGAWGQIKVPLIVLLISGLVFVAVTQPGMFNSMFAFAAAGAAGLPFLVSSLNARLRKPAEPSN
jgi:hypothetical protein